MTSTSPISAWPRQRVVLGLFLPTLLRPSTRPTPKSGYFFAITTHPDGLAQTVLASADACSAIAADTESEYFATGDPASAGSTGTRYFATDQQGRSVRKLMRRSPT